MFNVYENTSVNILFADFLFLPLMSCVKSPSSQYGLFLDELPWPLPFTNKEMWDTERHICVCELRNQEKTQKLQIAVGGEQWRALLSASKARDDCDPRNKILSFPIVKSDLASSCPTAPKRWSLSKSQGSEPESFATTQKVPQSL